MKKIVCVASVSLGISTRWRSFSLFGGEKIGVSATLMEGAGRRAHKPYGNACYAGYEKKADKQTNCLSRHVRKKSIQLGRIYKMERI